MSNNTRSNHEALLLTLSETARLLQLSPRTVWQWAKDGKLPCIRFGRVLRFPRRELEEWLSKAVEGKAGQEKGAGNE